jgi:hypothetical protein
MIKFYHLLCVLERQGMLLVVWTKVALKVINDILIRGLLGDCGGKGDQLSPPTLQSGGAKGKWAAVLATLPPGRELDEVFLL